MEMQEKVSLEVVRISGSGGTNEMWMEAKWEGFLQETPSLS